MWCAGVVECGGMMWYDVVCCYDVMVAGGRDGVDA